ncbi:MAG: ATP-binding protein [Candidatus Omnitrophota bacterium]
MIKRKILIVDDEAESRSAIERILLRAGYEAIQASSGRQALYILGQRKIECLLIDHLMPEMSGLELIRIIKNDEKFKIIPAIMLTAADRDEDVIAGLSAGADDYLIKTSSPEIIIARIEALLRLGKLQRDLLEKSIICEQANEELRKLDILKSEFIAVVSHELRTPLSITREGLNLILEEAPGPLNRQQRELLEVSQNNIERLGRIIGDILDISKIEAGKFPLHRSVVDLNQMLQDFFAFYKNTVEQKGINFSLEAPKHKVCAYCDNDRIIQVLTNLISNALKFTKEGGSIKIKLLEEDRELICAIEDTGAGIADSDMGKIFDKFQYFSKTDIPQAGGTGLGLSIAKKIVDMHKGRIWFKSKLGKGSEFTFSLPRYSESEIFNEHITDGIQEARERMSKFTVLSISVSGFIESAYLEALEDYIKKIMRRPGDTTLLHKERILIFLRDTNKENAQIIKNRVIEICNKFISEEKGYNKKVNFTAISVNYPDDVLSQEDLIGKILA